MAAIRIHAPLNQPEGNQRLLEQIRQNLLSTDFDHFFIITAFVREGPLLKLKQEIDSWKVAGKSIEAIFGIDENGTSTEALQYALANFNSSHIAKIVGGVRSTFHPKIYIFNGNLRSIAFIGSNNLTPGGFETNAESFIMLDMHLPADVTTHSEVMNCWHDTLRACILLDSPLLSALIADRKVITEQQMRSNHAKARASNNLPSNTTNSLFPRITIVAPTAVPKTVANSNVAAVSHLAINQPATVPQPHAVVANALTSGNVNALVIQIAPHHNGEIFLSKIALTQNPAFFGFPFTGKTTPKKSTNPSYPQRSPDPIVNLFIYNNSDTIVYQSLNLPLNTVYYTTKKDIRVTITPSVARTIQQGSILIVENSTNAGVDYELNIYPPGSPLYINYLNVCNQQMPSGGRGVGRKFGWI